MPGHYAPLVIEAGVSLENGPGSEISAYGPYLEGARCLSRGPRRVRLPWVVALQGGFLTRLLPDTRLNRAGIFAWARKM